MANKFYVYEKVTGGYELTSASWDQVQKIPRKSVKGFKTQEEAEAYLETMNSTYATGNDLYHEADNNSPSPLPPANLDAIIYCDGSFQDPGKNTPDAFCGGYGIMIFTKNGTYVESTFLSDPENQNTEEFLENSYFTEVRNKYEHKSKTFTQEIIKHPFKVYNFNSSYGYGMLHAGWASAAEFCGATRAIDICIKMKFKNVLLIYDANEVYNSCLKADAKDNTSNGSNLFKQKILEAKVNGLNIIVDEFSKVDSHENHVFDPSEHNNYFGKYDYIYNEAVDILAKIQLIDQPIFNSKKKNENRNIYAELLPDYSELINKMKEVNELVDRSDAIKCASEFVDVMLNMPHPYFM